MYFIKASGSFYFFVSEQELKELLQRKNDYAESNRHVQEEVENLTKLSSDLEDQLNRLKFKYESLQTSYVNVVADLKSQTNLPMTPPPHPPIEPQPQLWNGDMNCNNNNNSEKLSSSKKKRKNAKKNKKWLFFCHKLYPSLKEKFIDINIHWSSQEFVFCIFRAISR